MNSDPIADYLTRLRNAAQARHKRIELPCSTQKLAISQILKEQGYITDYKKIETSDKQGVLQVVLSYYEGMPAFKEIHRISRPGIRRYAGAQELPRVRNGLGVAIISTPKGVLTDKQARQMNVGGEVICSIW